KTERVQPEVALQMQEPAPVQRPDLLAFNRQQHVLAGEKLGHAVEVRTEVKVDDLVPARLVDLEGVVRSGTHGSSCVTRIPMESPSISSARPILTAISAKPFEFRYQKAAPGATVLKVRLAGMRWPAAISRLSSRSLSARSPVIALP